MADLKIIGDKILMASDLDRMNQCEVLDALSKMTGLPETLNAAANSLEVQAERKGCINVLAPKLRGYSEKISFLQKRVAEMRENNNS